MQASEPLSGPYPVVVIALQGDRPTLAAPGRRPALTPLKRRRYASATAEQNCAAVPGRTGDGGCRRDASVSPNQRQQVQAHGDLKTSNRHEEHPSRVCSKPFKSTARL